ncbi:MAG TPA: histidine kinase N-terminal 7TM domain-containing protein [Vicinamibacteria bacterium]|nr:histidine kinase N-terminal 7TM domain-containing protein [Vicinamibacteria bacterium]
MRWATAAYSVPVLLGGLLAAFLAWTGWRRRSVPGSSFFAVMMAGVSLWSIAYAVELNAGELATALLASNLLWAGVSVAPAAWLLFVLEHAGYGQRLTRPLIALLSVPAALTVLVAFTNGSHHLLRAQVWMESRGSYQLYTYTRGPAFWWITGYCYLLLLGGTVLLLTSLSRASRPYRRQAKALGAAALLPWVVNVIYVSDLLPDMIDITPFGFIGSGGLIAWALFRLGLLDLVPVAHEAVIESMADGVLVLDAASRVVDMNPAAAGIVGRAAPDAIGHPVASLLAGRPDLLERYGEVLEAREEISLAREGVERNFELRISPLRGRNGRPSGRLVVLRDVTERRQAEEAVRHAQKMESLGVLSRGVAHTFNNILAVIIGNASLAERKLDAGSPPAEHVAKIAKAAERAARIVHQMMSFSGGEPVSASLLDLSDLIGQSLDLFQAAVPTRIRVVAELAPALPGVLADPRHVQEALIHLLANSAEALGEHAGTVVLKTWVVDGAGTGWLFGDEPGPGPFVAVDLTDSGPGIPPDILPRIFDPFFTTHFEGRGLGLAAVRGIVKAHGGAIRVRTEPGRGTTVGLLFPTRTARSDASDSPPPR